MKRSLVPLFPPIFVALFGLAAVAFICGAGTYMPGVPPIETPLGKRLPFFFLFPFVALLAAIACLPALAGHWWEENVNKAKVAALAALPIAALLPFHFGRTGFDALLENVAEYVSLMALLVALFTVCGGIVIEGTPRGTPFVNAGILAIGAVLANFIGTTGASMILIRPLLCANAHRRKIVGHIPIFVIFIVANCGGLLTPLGDPPLFLGYLAGVPFGWTFKLFPAWAVVNGALLAIFVALDWFALSRERRRTTEQLRRRVPRPRLCVGVLRKTRRAAPRARPRKYPHAPGRRRRGLCRRPRSVPRRPRWPFGVQELLFVMLAVAAFRLTDPSFAKKTADVQTDDRSRRPLCRDLRHDDAGPVHTGRPRGRSACPIRGTTSGRRACFRAFWITHPRISFTATPPLGPQQLPVQGVSWPCLELRRWWPASRFWPPFRAAASSWGHDLYRKRAELHGAGACPGVEHPHAELRHVYGLRLRLLLPLFGLVTFFFFRV